MSKTTTIILVVLGCLLLAVASLALWVTLDIFNAERFGDKVAEGLQSPEASEALAAPIVDRLMESYPDLPAIARTPAEEVVAWILQRPLFTPVLKGVAAGAVKVMTTSAQDVVGIDIAEVAENAGSTVVGVISSVDEEAAAQAKAALDEAIATAEDSGPLAVYEKGTTPKLRDISNLAPWVGLLTLIGAVALFVLAYLRYEDQHSALKYIGVGVIATAVLGFLLLAPVVQAVAQNNIANPTMQVVVSAVISALMRAFAVQSLLIFSIGVIVLIVNHVIDEDAPEQAADVAANASDIAGDDDSGDS